MRRRVPRSTLSPRTRLRSAAGRGCRPRRPAVLRRCWSRSRPGNERWCGLGYEIDEPTLEVLDLGVERREPLGEGLERQLGHSHERVGLLVGTEPGRDRDPVAGGQFAQLLTKLVRCGGDQRMDLVGRLRARKQRGTGRQPQDPAVSTLLSRDLGTAVASPERVAAAAAAARAAWRRTGGRTHLRGRRHRRRTTVRVRRSPLQDGSLSARVSAWMRGHVRRETPGHQPPAAIRSAFVISGMPVRAITDWISRSVSRSNSVRSSHDSLAETCTSPLCSRTRSPSLTVAVRA